MSFGPLVPSEGIDGTLIRLKDNALGCNVSTFGPRSIPLLERGGCNILDKVLMMQKSGALAVIIGNYIENSNWNIRILQHEDVNVRIPALLITRLDFFALTKLLQDENNIISIRIVKEDGDDSFLNIFLVAFVWPCVMLGIFYLAIYIHRALLHCQKSHESQHAISIIPIRTFQSTESEDSRCCICLEVYKNGDSVKYTKCNHLFHPECIDEWLYYACVCPLCKTQLSD